MNFLEWEEVPSIRARLLHCNDDYNVIGIIITSNSSSQNNITISIHLFGDNIGIESWV